MAKPIHCDSPGCESLAFYMLDQIGTGSITALCMPHFGTWAAMLVQALAGDEPDAEAAAAAVGADDAPEAAESDGEAAEVFTCGACGVEFASMETIEQHVRDAHPEPVLEPAEA